MRASLFASTVGDQTMHIGRPESITVIDPFEAPWSSMTGALAGVFAMLEGGLTSRAVGFEGVLVAGLRHYVRDALVVDVHLGGDRCRSILERP